MILFPAIDIKDGKVVRLERGDFAKAKSYSDDPANQARDFADQGFSWLHVVDLDGAASGRLHNGTVIRRILSDCNLKVQLGGGMRDLAMITRWIEAGVERVVLGTVALRSPEIVFEACRAFPGRIVVGVDAKDGRVAVDGWANVSSLTMTELAKRFEDMGVASILYTDIERDGMLGGVNIDTTVALAKAVSIPVIASGGVRAISDIEALLPYETIGIEGVIIGRALYEKNLDGRAALELVRNSTLARTNKESSAC